jgi:hypothetical protein
MTLFKEEIYRIQNPAYGAVLAHSLASGYHHASATHASIPLPYIFAAMPCLFNRDFVETIQHTTSGLRAVVEKLNSSDKTGADLVPSLSKKAKQMRSLTLDSIGVLVAARLAALDLGSATLTPLRQALLTGRPELPPETKAAERLGSWLAMLTPFEISSLLKVTF